MSAPGLVFSDYRYVLLAAAIFAGMLFPLLLVSEYVFLEPYFVGHILQGTELGLVLIVALAGLAGVVLPMNVYRISMLKTSRKKMSGGVLGSMIGSVAGACGCGPVGFALFSTFGSIGATASAFLSNYEIPIRLVAVGLLAVTYYTTVRSLKMECRVGQTDATQSGRG